MHSGADAETLVVEIVVVGGPSVDEGVGHIDGEFDFVPSEAYHQLWFEHKMRVVVALGEALGAVVEQLYLVPLGHQDAAFETQGDIEAVVEQSSPAEVYLTESHIVVAVDVVGVVIEVGDCVVVGEAVGVADVALEHGEPEGLPGAGGDLEMAVFDVGETGGSLNAEHIDWCVGDGCVDGGCDHQGG